MDSEYEKKFVYLLDEYERYILFIVSLFFAALGVTITKRGKLGVSPISSIPNVMISRIDSLSLGMWLIIWNCILIVGQILILKKTLNRYSFCRFLSHFFLEFSQISECGVCLMFLFLITRYAYCLSSAGLSLSASTWHFLHCKCNYELRRSVCKGCLR